MKQYKFNLKEECMKELPSMEEPEKLYGRESWQPPVIGSYICSYCGYHSSTAIHDMKHYCIYDKYEEHLASLQLIPVLKKYLSSFTDGKIYNKDEFKIKYSDMEYSLDKLALPKVDSVEQWSKRELFDALREVLIMPCIMRRDNVRKRELQEHFTITRKIK